MAGRFARSLDLARAAWSVVPVLVTRDVGPVDAVKESAELLRRTWGENLIGNFGLGFVLGLGYFGLAIVAFLALSALHATMQGVYSAALYRDATGRATPPPGFGPELLDGAFAAKR
jgi:hypothetical protein